MEASKHFDEGSPIAQETTDGEISDLDKYKTGLHTMVMDLEEMGSSALPSLLQVRGELRVTRNNLMRQSSFVGRQLREANYQDGQAMQEFVRLEEEQILVYHELVWIEGYIRDRQKS